MKQEVILVLDCGATNVRAIAVDRQGKIIARASTPNASDIAAENGIWHQWSLEAILQRFAGCCQRLSTQLANCRICGIAVTTSGIGMASSSSRWAIAARSLAAISCSTRRL